MEVYTSHSLKPTGRALGAEAPKQRLVDFVDHSTAVFPRAVDVVEVLIGVEIVLQIYGNRYRIMGPSFKLDELVDIISGLGKREPKPTHKFTLLRIDVFREQSVHHYPHHSWAQDAGPGPDLTG